MAEQAAAADQLAAVIAEIDDWLGSGGLFNPSEMNMLTTKGHRAVFGWREQLEAVATALQQRGVPGGGEPDSAMYGMWLRVQPRAQEGRLPEVPGACLYDSRPFSAGCTGDPIMSESRWPYDDIHAAAQTQPAAQGPEEPVARINARLLAGCKAALGAWERNDAINWDELADAITEAEALPAEAPAETRLCSFCPDPIGPAYGSDDLKHTICRSCIEKAARFFRASASAVSLTADEWDKLIAIVADAAEWDIELGDEALLATLRTLRPQEP